ncbi:MULTISPECIES: group II intron reverse transcriptase/maturase [Prosthecochloris]|uniref:RNA-directed DNA polymerase n=1 Tax=Prosthecochloris vibrioformis TaxID=1098 RepID=A0A5C4RQB3_PROVB|nr:MULTISPECIES: group II intron reverse transcriptase/maturase [Prosthecochloris]ANT64764.1 Group II intron-encoded protein LtrA [Prosthecochloris sp. CIB 2401]TNJ33416.1 group II intron reverse transcriptase/maturase [Prosthecochloris vibrioformis]
MTKSFEISKKLVWEAYQCVKANEGAAGVDHETIEQFDRHLKDNLYKIWNRMSSGSYFPPPVKGVPIPKKSGGERMLGIPTVSDRIAQTVVKLKLEPILEPLFHQNSYGYRPGRSALDAVAMVRRRSWEYDWVVEFDIKGLFDNIDHDLLMRALRKHCETPWILLYVERWLKAPMQTATGAIVERTSGTPQGGVVSPLLANLFLHYAFDMWVTQNLRSVRFCRYADDGVIHCKSREQAEFALRKIRKRFEQCRLELHPDKTRIAYCQDVNRQEVYPNVQFTFLGYTFRPRRSVDKYGRLYVNFSPAVSREALKAMRQTIRGWHIQLRCDRNLQDLAARFNAVLRGWNGYYGKFYGSAMSVIWRHMNMYLMRWLMRKYKHLAGHKIRARKALGKLAQSFPNEFVHWQLGYVPKAG